MTFRRVESQRVANIFPSILKEIGAGTGQSCESAGRSDRLARMVWISLLLVIKIFGNDLEMNSV